MGIKVGDTVKIIDAKFMLSRSNGDAQKYLNTVHKVIRIDTFGRPFILEDVCVFGEGDNHYCFNEDELELVQQSKKKFTKADLKERYIVKLRKENKYGQELIYSNGYFNYIVEGKVTSLGRCLSYYEIDLTYSKNHDYDIVEVHKPKYETIWTRPEEPQEAVKEMTVEEVSKLVGCKVKIVEKN